MNTDQQTTQSESTPRRSFLNWIWALLSAIACLEVGWLINSILKSSDNSKRQNLSTFIDAGMTSDYRPGSVKAIPQGQFYLACLEDGSFLALSKKCTHLGCSVPWHEGEKKFICPCHGSTFDTAGKVLTPPALRPLDYYPIRLENGLIRVEISRPLKRQKFDRSQTVKI